MKALEQKSSQVDQPVRSSTQLTIPQPLHKNWMEYLTLKATRNLLRMKKLKRQKLLNHHAMTKIIKNLDKRNNKNKKAQRRFLKRLRSKQELPPFSIHSIPTALSSHLLHPMSISLGQKCAKSGNKESFASMVMNAHLLMEDTN